MLRSCRSHNTDCLRNSSPSFLCFDLLNCGKFIFLLCCKLLVLKLSELFDFLLVHFKSFHIRSTPINNIAIVKKRPF